jgi:twitching motility protein PilT
MRRKALDQVLTRMLEQYPTLSDCNFTVGNPLQVEVDGELHPACPELGIVSLTPYQTEVIAMNLIGNDRRCIQHLLQHGSCDLSYQIAGLSRYRVNVFSQRECYSVVMRRLPTMVPSIEELQLPAVLKQIAQEKNGIVILCGATGTGKSTSIAAILDEINGEHPLHIVTLEDPVEFVHEPVKATFNQRELGTDFDTFANGLRAALRQAPKVILVGEMRDRETVEIALSAAETGHLVLTSLHTVDAGQTINRLIGMFQLEEERLVRIRLADALRWVVAQRLLPKAGGGRVAAFEIMGTNLRVQEAVINGESEGKTFYDIIEKGGHIGWVTFDNSVLQIYQQGTISEKTALDYASKRAIVKRGIDWLKSERGEKTTDIEGLKIDDSYRQKLERKDLQSW